MATLHDRAEQVLQRIAKVWLVDSERIRWKKPDEPDALGFEWWPGDFRTGVRAHFPTTPEQEPQLRVTICTDFLKNTPTDSETFEQMIAESSVFSTSTYGWVYRPNPDREQLTPSEERPGPWFSSSGYITPEIIDWLPDLLATTAIIQVVNAQIQARGMAEIFGGAPHITRPVQLRDSGLDGILGVLEEVYVPLGKDPSRWAGTDEFKEFAETWARSDVCFGTGDASEMTLETPFGDASALIRFRTAEKHLQLGHGLLATLQLPCFDDGLTIARLAALLNFLESAAWTGFPQLGCWHASLTRGSERGLGFALFMPNALYRPGLATNIAFWLVARARWAREQLLPDQNDVRMIDVLRRRYGDIQAD